MSMSGDNESYVDSSGAEAYDRSQHGIDGAVLLDPVFKGHMQRLCPDNVVLDAGCGASPWAIYAAELGASRVVALDNNPEMIRRSQENIGNAPEALQKIIELMTADVAYLPIADQTVDAALSINVGCALPSEEKGSSNQPFKQHFNEMARVLRPGGYAVITAPASLETPFTISGDYPLVEAHEAQMLKKLEADLEELTGENAEEMKKVVGARDEILRASIVQDGPHWKLVKQLFTLNQGQFIYRKIPGLVVPNYNHGRDEYHKTITGAGLEVENFTAKRISSLDPNASASKLGRAYLHMAPFHVYLAKKPEEVA